MPAHRPDAAVQAELADHARGRRVSRGRCARRAEHGAGDGEVEAAAALGDGSGAESDGELLLRPGVAGVHDGGPHPVPALHQALVGQPHQGEGGDAGFEVGLDLDHDALDADQRDRAGACESHVRPPPARARPRARPCGAAATPTRSMRTPPGGGPPWPREPAAGEAFEPVGLGRGDGGHGMFVGAGPAGLDLAEDQQGPPGHVVAGDDVDLAGPAAPPVAFQDGHSGRFQQSYRQVFAVLSECSASVHPAPPPAPTVTHRAAQRVDLGG